MPRMTQYEREEGQLDRDLTDGRISPAQHREQLRDLQRDFGAAVEEEAERAADMVRDSYGW